MPSIVSRQARVYHRRDGNGRPLLVLSHIGVGAYQRHLTPSLGAEWSLVYVDLPGTGLSTGSLRDLSVAGIVEDLEALCDALGLSRVHVFGHSVLGILAAEYAWRCPHRVEGAVLACTPPIANWVLLRAEADQHFASTASPERKACYKARVAALSDTSSWRDRLQAEAPRRYFDVNVAPPRSAVDEPLVYEAARRVLSLPDVDWDIAERAAHRTTPLFIASGRHDFVVPAPLWEARLPALPHATYRCFERSGHEPFHEEPTRFAEALGAWASGGMAQCRAS